MEAKQVQAKLRLAESYAALVEEMSDENITVNMIAVNAGKHRKTFYYHFNSKEQLVIWLFRYDLAKGLTERFDEKLLVSDEDTSDEPWSGFPFYVRNVKDSSRIYNTPFFGAFAEALETRRTYYRTILSKRGPGTLDFYLHQLYKPVFEKDIVLLIDAEVQKYNPLIRNEIRHQLSNDQSIVFLAEFYTGAFLSRFVERLLYFDKRRLAKDIIPFENVIHDSMRLLIAQSAFHANNAVAYKDR